MKREKPSLVIVAGPNGSGKTTLTEKVLAHEWVRDCAYINPDYIARDQFGDWNNRESILKAACLADSLRERYLQERVSLAFETVLSSPAKVEYIMRARQAGYFIRLFFVSTNHPAINAARITHRVMQGGHEVPISKIISRYSNSVLNCIHLATMVDRAYVYDNSVDQKMPRLLFKTVDGRLAKVYAKPNPWALTIAKQLPLAEGVALDCYL